MKAERRLAVPRSGAEADRPQKEREFDARVRKPSSFFEAAVLPLDDSCVCFAMQEAGVEPAYAA